MKSLHSTYSYKPSSKAVFGPKSIICNSVYGFGLGGTVCVGSARVPEPALWDAPVSQIWLNLGHI
jgi:hypothetical protein